jgi:hypothetical protein
MCGTDAIKPTLCHSVKKAHGADGNVDAGGCQLALL